MAMQSALRNPDKSMDNSRQVRIIKIDLATLNPVAEYAYFLEDATTFKNLVQADIVKLKDQTTRSDLKVRRVCSD
ncbi:hypothetical protein J2T13_002197 [Paenibacillus sp. DS2015]